PTLYNGPYSYSVQVPAGATQMRVQLTSDDPSVDVDLFARHNADVAVNSDGDLVTDYYSEDDTGNETMVITKQSSPPLQAGVYYFSIAEYATSKPSTGTIVVTFDTGAGASVNTSGAALQSGVPATYSFPAASSPTLYAGSS